MGGWTYEVPVDPNTATYTYDTTFSPPMVAQFADPDRAHVYPISEVYLHNLGPGPCGCGAKSEYLLCDDQTVVIHEKLS